MFGAIRKEKRINPQSIVSQSKRRIAIEKKELKSSLQNFIFIYVFRKK
jgi:hypothetical protein